MPDKELINDVAIIEQYIILLLGAIDQPIPSPVHLQKEIFILSKVNSKINEFLYFDKHYKGPYSYDLDEISKSPTYYKNAYIHDDSYRFYITNEGQKFYKKIIESYHNNSKFQEYLALVKMTRELYDKLTEDELLLLIYSTYGEFTEKSSVSERILAPLKRKELAIKLLKKGLITEKRFDELVG